MDEALTVQDIFTRLGELMQENAGTAMACLAGLVGVNIALDLTIGDAGTLPAGIASLVAQYVLVRTALERRGLRDETRRNGLGAFWGVNILSGLGILLGYVLLIVPGIFLSVRWSVASAVLLAEEQTVSGALGESWALTRPNLWPILGVLLVIFVPAAVIAIGVAGMLIDQQPLIASLILYPVIFAAFVSSWLLSVALYSLLRPTQDHLSEIFA
ncbi:hypothetical protein G4G27_18300 [Sphingomonas sp. So64.6b]|uniref:hypothetical protein n=1 Tax=Sphingomonas sp. So64.6b TaxID=2997354 RepID=UPI0015FEDC2B|nr:hypothetical protein [Sphingomonas sp. So64.6b]QNA85714.1 hypothetical protein G4G27_18300 [Sphingomonas sp. So64.6b]